MAGAWAAITTVFITPVSISPSMIDESPQTRRSFLKALGLTASAAVMTPATGWARTNGRPVIDRVEVFPITYPMVGRFKFFEDPEGRLTGRASAVVKITADNGAVGWGESIPIPKWSYETLESVTTTIRSYLASQLVGHPVYDIAGAHQIMNRNIAPSFATGQPMAKAGVDIALHDLAGKISGQSLFQKWGQKPRKEIELSWTLNPKTLDDVGRLIEQGKQQGFRHFNVKVATNPAFDLELCRQVKKQAPDAFLWADANGGYDRMTALRLAPKFADIGVDVLEQPLPSNDLTAYRELKRQAALPILMDEGVVSPRSLIEFIRLDLLDGVAMKIPRCGGLRPAHREIEILQDAGLMFLGSGLTDPGTSLAATLALYGAFDYSLPAALNGPQFIDASILREPLTPENGKLAVPEGPGLGVEVDEDKVRELMVDL